MRRCLLLSLAVSLLASLSPLHSHAAGLRVFFGTSESFALDGFVSGVCQVDTSFTDALSFPTGVVADTGSHRLTCNDDGSASYQHFTDLECKSGAGPEHVAPGEGECAVAQGVSYCLYCAATFPAPANRTGTTLYSDAACTARLVGPRYGEVLAGDCDANEGRQYYCSADGEQLNRIDFAGTTCEPNTWISVAKWDAGASTCVPVAKRDGEGDTVVYRRITCPSVVATPSPMAFPLDMYTAEPFTIRNACSATDCSAGCEPFLAERLGLCSLTYAGSSAFSRARICSADGAFIGESTFTGGVCSLAGRVGLDLSPAGSGACAVPDSTTAGGSSAIPRGVYTQCHGVQSLPARATIPPPLPGVVKATFASTTGCELAESARTLARVELFEADACVGLASWAANATTVTARKYDSTVCSNQPASAVTYVSDACVRGEGNQWVVASSDRSTSPNRLNVTRLIATSNGSSIVSSSSSSSSSTGGGGSAASSTADLSAATAIHSAWTIRLSAAVALLMLLATVA